MANRVTEVSAKMVALDKDNNTCQNVTDELGVGLLQPLVNH